MLGSPFAQIIYAPKRFYATWRLREFLTGFHKRKVQKKEDSKKKREERERQERLEMRREVRIIPIPNC